MGRRAERRTPRRAYALARPPPRRVARAQSGTVVGWVEPWSCTAKPIDGFPPADAGVNPSYGSAMASLDAVSLTILLGAAMVLAGIMSSLVALRFGAPLLLVFLIIGMLAGEAGPGGIRFEDVRSTYTVGSIALALILFDGGLRTRFSTFRTVLAPATALATVGVLLTAAITAPVAKAVLGISWLEAFLVGAMVGS